MAKAPFITDSVIQTITEVYLSYPNWRAKEIRYEVDTRLHRENPHLQRDWPGLSTVQKKLAIIRKNNDGRSPESKALDRPWSIGSLVEFDISSDAIPKVVQIANDIYDTENPLTIRRAMWIGRLHALNKNLSDLFVLSDYYSLKEKAAELTGIPNDTSMIDDIVLTQPVIALNYMNENLTPPYRVKGLNDEVIKLEKDFNVDLEKTDLEGAALFMYVALLINTLEHPDEFKISSLSKEDLVRLLVSFREHAKRAGKNVDMGIIDNKSLVNNLIKEVRNEGPHNKTRQE